MDRDDVYRQAAEERAKLKDLVLQIANACDGLLLSKPRHGVTTTDDMGQHIRELAEYDMFGTTVSLDWPDLATILGIDNGG